MYSRSARIVSGFQANFVWRRFLALDWLSFIVALFYGAVPNGGPARSLLAQPRVARLYGDEHKD
jgi:hypothetical protein